MLILMLNQLIDVLNVHHVHYEQRYPQALWDLISEQRVLQNLDWNEQKKQMHLILHAQIHQQTHISQKKVSHSSIACSISQDSTLKTAYKRLTQDI